VALQACREVYTLRHSNDSVVIAGFFSVAMTARESFAAFNLMYLDNFWNPIDFQVAVQMSHGFFCVFCVHDTAATNGQNLT